MWSRLHCWLFGHRYVVALQWTGHNPGEVRAVKCQNCPCRWIMSDYHKSFLRYDNDPRFRDDLLQIYSGVRNLDTL